MVLAFGATRLASLSNNRSAEIRPDRRAQAYDQWAQRVAESSAPLSTAETAEDDSVLKTALQNRPYEDHIIDTSKDERGSWDLHSRFPLGALEFVGELLFVDELAREKQVRLH